MNATEIQRVICRTESLKFNIPCERVKFLFSDWECDVLSLGKQDYITEFEVKVSKSDFKADAKKKKWKFYNDQILVKEISNYFYYACPVGLISKEEIPAFAGLIYVSNDHIDVIKKAPLIHRVKHDRIKILTKFCRIMTEREYLGNCRLTIENMKNKRAICQNSSTH